ncbi:MAG TPA: hypothetical protein VJ962_10585 [Clostridia bacterium]|nr:hypothetical protein [Clostridia bacterium]
MKTAKIEETLKSILEIDQNGKEKTEAKEALYDKQEKRLAKKKREIEREYMKEARLETKEKREKIYTELEREVATIHSNTNIEIQRLNFILENNIDSITHKIFRKILKNI